MRWRWRWRSPVTVTVAIVVGFFALWEVLARTEVLDPTALVPASEMFRRIPEILTSGSIGEDLRVTALQVGVSFVLAMLIGATIGWSMWRFTLADRALSPYLSAMAGFPMIVFFPVMVGMFGVSNTPYIVIATLLAVIPVALTTTTALRAVPRVLHKLGRSLNATGFRRYWSILLPSALPHLMPGIRLGFLFSILGVISTQFLLGSRGIGFRVFDAYGRFNTQEMYAYVAVIVLIAAGSHILLQALERKVRKDVA